jgi:hypothetical protein
MKLSKQELIDHFVEKFNEGNTTTPKCNGPYYFYLKAAIADFVAARAPFP